MKYFLTIFIFLLLATPSQAHAGFLLGYIMGSGTSSNSQQHSVVATSIPPACFFSESLESYRKCRIQTAYPLYQDHQYAMAVEWYNIIQPLQEEAAKENLHPAKIH